jgi:Ca2+-binding EF-hand superfamily protein
MQRHGKIIKPKLSDEEKQQLKMTFNLMDADGGGTIDGEVLLQRVKAQGCLPASGTMPPSCICWK